jgi:hypothetical protein
MGTLVFVCPTTGHEVSTGVEVDRSNYKRLSRTKTAVFCPRCRKNHILAAIWAWLVDEVREAPTKVHPRSLLRRSFASGSKRSNPIHEPFRSPSAMLLRGTPLA